MTQILKQRVNLDVLSNVRAKNPPRFSGEYVNLHISPEIVSEIRYNKGQLENTNLLDKLYFCSLKGASLTHLFHFETITELIL